MVLIDTEYLNAALQPGNTPAAGGTEESQSEGPAKITVNDLVIDCNEHRVYIKGKEIFLTKKENDILVLLVKYPNKIFSRDDILKLVWKNESFVLDRTVDVHIARLRKKMGNYGDMIINRSGLTIRLDVSTLRVMGRNTQGVKLINLRNDDAIAAVAKVSGTKEEEMTAEGGEGYSDETAQENTQENEEDI